MTLALPAGSQAHDPDSGSQGEPAPLHPDTCCAGQARSAGTPIHHTRPRGPAPLTAEVGCHSPGGLPAPAARRWARAQPGGCCGAPTAQPGQDEGKEPSRGADACRRPHQDLNQLHSRHPRGTESPTRPQPGDLLRTARTIDRRFVIHAFVAFKALTLASVTSNYVQ